MRAEHLRAGPKRNELDRHGVIIRHRMASVFGLRPYVEAGGLFSYGADIDGLYRHAADFVDRIAKGAKPADLPIEQPTKLKNELTPSRGALGE